ncbi:unnamed protein product [Urochloa decumbens]|uniref:Uncharacterized protein n=1 Tax=Urochloa decumbens TaxID=240449 RepID=A0ABC9C1W0_9POAL
MQTGSSIFDRFSGTFASVANPSEVRRNRASPSRLFKLYKHLSDDQKKLICGVKFGGLLHIACPTIPLEFANWLMVECFDAESSQLVLPGRGKILVTAETVANILGLPDKGDTVRYELDVEAINFIHEKYNVGREGIAPKIGDIVTRVKENKEANDDFLRSWLMLAVSTFLCPPTSTGISPRCYTSLVDLSKVKDLNCCQFVVDQLKQASSNLNKKNSVRGCIQLLAVLYADSVEVRNVQPPSTKPRIAAWTRKMLDTVITQDTNRDGSFGKLKLKNSAHSVLQDTFIQMDDVQRFVSSMAPRGTTDQNKRKLSQAVIKVISGVTQLLGTFVHEVGAIGIGQNEETSVPSLRRSKRKRTTEHEEPELVHEDIAEDSDYEEEPEFVDEETTEESDYEDEGDAEYEGDAYHTSNIDPIPEGGEEAGNGAHGTIPDGQRSASNLEHDQTDEEEHMPLISRLRAIQQVAHHKGPDEQEHNQRSREQAAAHHDVICELVALEVMPPTQVGTVPPASKPVTIKERKLRLKLPTATGTSFDATKDNKSGEGCSHKMSNASPISRSNSLDFTPPDFDIMKSIDEQEPTTSGWQLSTPQLDNHSGLQGNDPSSSCSLDQIECEFWQKVEEDAIEQVKKRKISSAQLEGATTVDIKGHEDAVQIRTDVAATVVGTTITPVSVRKEPGSVNSSVTPAYQPAPRRQPRKGAALQSPYVGITAVNSFRCSKDVCDVYNAVLASQGPTTRSSPKSKKEVIIINYYDFHITLNELALLVKPGGKLDCVVAEIGLFAIDPVGRKATKRVLPLRVAGYLQSGQLARSEVKRVFRLGTNHLDHRQMVIFPVLQNLSKRLRHDGWTLFSSRVKHPQQPL